MTSRRSFLQGGGKALAAARLIGTTTASGMFLADAAQTLGGAAKSVVIPTHEHWGDLEERLDFPAAWDIHVQNMAGHDAHVLTREEILQRIQAPIGSRPLREIAAGKRSAIVTFDDLTRPTPAYDVAPLVVDELLAAGVPEDRIVFMGSYGTHRNLEADEVVRKLGQNLVRRFAWINHNTWDNLVEVGTTSRKNRVRINQTFVKADLRVTISGIKSHGMAGFGGGAKAVLPGVAALDTVEYNHTTFRGGRPAPGVISLFQNELRLDMVDAARLAKVDFSVQIVYNGRRKVCGIFAGDIVDAHHAACRMAIKHYSTERFPNPDVVISNSYPQSTQAAFAGGEWARTVKAGGSVVLVMQHPQGLSAWHFLDQRTDGRNGRTYLDILANPRRPMQADNQLIVYSQYIDKQEMNKFPRNTLFAYTWDEVLRQLQARHKGDASVAVYPYAAIQHSQTELDEPKA
jgi:nickel-dependent lactate racemase